MKRHDLLIMLFFVWSLTVHRADAFVTQVGGESVNWTFQGIPDSSFFHADQPCYYKADTDFWVCEYGIVDPPYINPITFSATLSPTHGGFPNLGFYYSGVSQYPYHLINEVQTVHTGTLNNQASFFLPASATAFRLLYHSNDQLEGATQTNIQFNFQIANYDPNRANLLGGDEINADTEYCDNDGQPGKPRIKKFKNKKGAGPGT